MQLKVRWSKMPFRTYSCWVCRYGNIVTESQISPERCFNAHLKKLQKLGVDISKFAPTPVVIKESE